MAYLLLYICVTSNNKNSIAATDDDLNEFDFHFIDWDTFS